MYHHFYKKTLLFIFFMVAAAVCLMPTKTGSRAASTYQVKVNKQQNCVTIYRLQSDGGYKPVKAMTCSTGYATQPGTYSLGSKMRWHTLNGPCYGQYCSRIYGGVLFHSVWYTGYNNPGTLSVSSYNKLGTTASHGCVRLTTADAKWIFDNVPSGTPITIYNSSDPGPLGKPAAIKIPYSTPWDPTDIWSSSNPWNKKRPSISGVKSISIPYGTAYQATRGVTGRNTTGYDATARIQVRVRYHGKYVKAVDTTRPGKYKVIYILKDEIGRIAKKTASVQVTAKLPIPRIKGVRDLYLKDRELLTKGRALREVTVTQKKQELPGKYISVTFKKLQKNVYLVTYEAQRASEAARATAKAYIDSKAPVISGLKEDESYPLTEGQAMTESYARSLIKVSDNVSKLSISDVEVQLTKEQDGYQVKYLVRDQAGNKTVLTVHFILRPVENASGAAVTL